MTDRELDIAETKKKSRFASPSVTLMPGLRGVRVVDGKNGAETLTGDLIPWHRIWFHTHQGGTTTRILDESGNHMESNGSRISASVRNRANAAQRAQRRSMLSWVRTSNEPISFVPREQPIWAVLILSLMMFPLLIYLLIISAQQLSSLPPHSGAGWFALMQLVFVFFITIFYVWFVRTMGPGKQHFESIDLLPSGFIGTTFSGEVVSIEFDSWSKPRVRHGDPGRLQFLTEAGRTMSFAIPKPIDKYLSTALNPPSQSQAEARRAESRKHFWVSVRVILVGFLLAIVMYFFVGWLGQAGLILPQDAARIQRSCLPLAGLPTFFGLQIMYLSWKHSDNGIQTRSRVARYFERRKKRKDQGRESPNTSS